MKTKPMNPDTHPMGSDAVNRWLMIGIGFILIFSPLAFGSVHTWAYTFMVVWVGGLWLVHIMSSLFLKPSSIGWVRTPANPAIGFLILLLTFQALVLPAGIIKYLSPVAYADKVAAHQLLAQLTSDLNASLSWTSLAYYRHPVLLEGIKLVTCVGFFFLVLHVCRTKKRIEILIYLLIVTGLFEAIYAIFQSYSTNPRVWWWKSRMAQWASGTFIGPNHFCFYMEMVFGLGIGFLISQRDHRPYYTPGLISVRALFQRLIILFSPESAHPRMIFFFFVCLLSGFALLRSASRGGILSMGCAMFCVSSMFLCKPHFRRFGLVTLIICLVVAIYGIQVGIDPTVEKFHRTRELAIRIDSTRFLLPIIGDYPFTGVGWGNLRYMYQKYMTDEFDPIKDAGFAHNDWLEAGSEAGLMGLGLLAIGYVAFLLRIFRIWRQRRDPFAVGIGAGILIVMISVGLHSFVDFSLHIPANALTLAAILALGFAATHRKGHGLDEVFFYTTRKWQLNTRWAKALVGLVAVCCFGAMGTFVIRHFTAEIHCPTEYNSTLKLNWDPYLTDIQKAVAINPINAAYRIKLAGYYSETPVDDPTLQAQFTQNAIDVLSAALALNPANPAAWYQLGKQMTIRARIRIPDNSPESQIRLAEQCFDMALALAPANVNLLFSIGSYYLVQAANPSSTGGQHPKPSTDNTQMQNDQMARFQHLFRRALAIQPTRWQWAAERVWRHFPDDAILLKMVPDNRPDLKQQMLQWAASR